MLESIRLRNVQSHEDNLIEFHPGVNAIVGRSGSGKSDIIRAVRLVLENKPSGDSLTSWWGGDLQIDAVFDDGKISRIKNSKFNGYVLNGTELKDGRSVPAPVSEFLNMSEVNFQTQQTKPFMLDWSPGERGVYLNKLVKLDIVDQSITRIKSRVTKRSAANDALGTTIKAKTAELENFAGLDSMEERLTVLEGYASRIATLEEQDFALDKLLDDISDCYDILAEYDKTLSMEGKVDALLATGRELDRLDEEWRGLTTAIANIKFAEEDMAKFEAQTNSLVEDLQKRMPDICPLCDRKGSRGKR